MFFYPDSPDILETRISILKFQVFPDGLDRNQICSFVFGRSYGSTILLRDLLTFSNMKRIRAGQINVVSESLMAEGFIVWQSTF